MTRPRLLDLFSGAGGASHGYALAGFDVTGVDIVPQKHYPYAFVQAEALEFLEAHGDEYDVIHASPPCQRYSRLTRKWGARRHETHPDLIEPTRDFLRQWGGPYIIENIEDARAELRDPVRVCGSALALGARIGDEFRQLRRHRLFESNVPLVGLACRHEGRALGVYGHAGGRSVRDGLSFSGTDSWREGMGISWMTGKELAEAIPPAFAAYIGGQIREACGW